MVVTLRSSTREARAADASAHAPLVDYSSSDEGDGDRGDPTWVPSGPEGFDVSSKSPPGSPMEADETNAPGENVEFNLGAGSFTPKKSRLPRSNARSGHTRGSRRAASPMPTTPPPTAGSESPESPSLSLFDNVSWPVRPGSRTRDAASEGGPRRSASTPAPATHASASGTPESIPASTATPFKKSPGVVGDASPFGPESSSAAGSPDPRDRPFRPFEGFETSSQTSTRGLDTSAPGPCHFATPPVTEFSNLSFNLGSGGGRRASGASARRRGSTRGGASPGTSPGRGKVRVEGTPGSREPPRFVGASAFASNEAASFFPRARPETNAPPFRFTPPPPAASPPTFPTFGDAGPRGGPFAATGAGAFAPGAFAPGSSDPKPKTGRTKKTPKKKPSASARAAPFAPTPPDRSPTEAAKDRLPPSIFAAASFSSPPASPATASRRSPLRRASRPQKSASPTPSPPSSPMDILRERVASVNLGREWPAPDSAAAAHRAAAAGAANVSFTFSNASSDPRATPGSATRLKEAGNAAFKAGRYQVASANYDEALERMAREFPTEPVPEAARDAWLADEADASLAGRASFVAGGRDAAVCYANRAAARLMNVNDATRRGAPEGAVAGDARAPATRRALAAASDVRAALRDCRAALAADPSFRRARLRAGTCLMRLGAFEDAHAEFLIAAEGDAGGTAAEARRLAGDAARGGALVDSLTRVDGGALASLRRRCIEGASVGAQRVKTRVFRAAEGSGGLDGSLGDDEDALEGLADSSGSPSNGSPSKKNGAATTARDVLRSVRDVSAVAPHCAAVAEARARALLWEGRFEDAAAAADAEGLGGAAHRRGACASRDASLADASPRAFALETGGERWRARVRAAARFATGDLAGAAAAMEASGGDGSRDRSREEPFGGDDDDETRSKPPVSKRSNASVMNDDASLVAARVARALEAAEKDAFADLIGAARAAHSLRVQGNASFKAKAYARASEIYSQAVDAVADAPGGALGAAFAAVCLCNRAAAAHAEGRVADALADCGRALALNPARVKSLSRRAQLYTESRMHDAAADDLRRLLATLAPATRVSAGEENERRARAALADAAAGVETLDKTSLADLRDGVSARLREANAAARCAPTPDHAAVLGLRAGASSASASGLGPVADSDVKKSYHRLALKHHPDKSCAGLPGWADAEALRRDAGAVFKLVGEAHAALASAEKRRAFDAADRKARNARDDFGFSTFARDAARHAASRRGGGGSPGGGSARGGYRRAGGAHRDGGGGSFYGDWFGEDNRASGRGAYRPRKSGGGGGYKT